VGYFNSERFWECHETLESVWRPAVGEEKKLVQGIILVCAALVHEQRGERDVGLGIYRRALPQIAWREKTYHGIDVPRLRKNVERSLAMGELSPFKI
jgi:predicted metal-dependent hydrolase